MPVWFHSSPTSCSRINKRRLCCHYWHLKDTLLWDYMGSAWGCVAFFTVHFTSEKGKNIISWCFCVLGDKFYITILKTHLLSSLQSVSTGWDTTTSAADGIRYKAVNLYSHTFSSPNNCCCDINVLFLGFFSQHCWNIFVGLCWRQVHRQGIYSFHQIFPASCVGLASSWSPAITTLQVITWNNKVMLWNPSHSNK